MTEDEFRAKYPHSTDEQVRLYLDAVAAEAASPPVVEPLGELMPLITVPVVEQPIPEVTVTTYDTPLSGTPLPRFFLRNFSLDDVPPEVGSDNVADDLREILLASRWLSPEQRHRIGTEAMSEADLLAIMVGAPTAAEFAAME